MQARCVFVYSYWLCRVRRGQESACKIFDFGILICRSENLGNFKQKSVKALKVLTFLHHGQFLILKTFFFVTSIFFINAFVS